MITVQFKVKKNTLYFFRKEENIASLKPDYIKKDRYRELTTNFEILHK